MAGGETDPTPSDDSEDTSVHQEAPTDVTTLLRFVEVATGALAEAREEIDALNIYPVPDGDTGTNMFLTLSSARDALHEAIDQSAEPTSDDWPRAVACFSRGALMGARGNSGVILSQMLGAMVKHLLDREAEERHADRWADAMLRATAASYEAVGTPVEGTILSVSRAAAEAARAAADAMAADVDDVGSIVGAAADAAREALARTPTQLQVLADAGVVDAGGRGLCVLLDALETALNGRRALADPGKPVRPHIPVPIPAHDLTAEGPSYEVMYLLDAEDGAIPELRRRLAALGDSLVVVGGDGLWNVHVHVDDVGAAIEVGIDSGRPHRVRVTHFADQMERRTPSPPSAPGGSWSPCRRETASATSSRRPVQSWCPAGPGGGPARACCWTPSVRAAPLRRSCCPTTTTRCARRRSPSAVLRPSLG